MHAPCSRAAPCLTFSFAHGQTDAGGEINCVDAGNFGSVTITKNITIDCAGTVGGINPVGATAGIVVNTAGVTVRLRNLTINGMSTGTIGVQFSNGTALFVENCSIANFNGGVAGEGIGIKFAPPTGVTGELYVKDSFISSSGRAGDGGGIVIQPAGTGSARVAIERTMVENNTFGIFALGAASTGGLSAQIRDSVVAESKLNGITSSSTGGASITSLTLERSSALLNGSGGVVAQGTNAFITLAESTVMSNVTGLSTTGGGLIFSYQDNQLTGNITDGAPTNLITVK